MSGTLPSSCTHTTPLTPPLSPRPPLPQMAGSWSKAVHTFDQGKALFERRAVDRFTIRVPDCGDLQALRVWHDGTGFASDW